MNTYREERQTADDSEQRFVEVLHMDGEFYCLTVGYLVIDHVKKQHLCRLLQSLEEHILDDVLLSEAGHNDPVQVTPCGSANDDGFTFTLPMETGRPVQVEVSYVEACRISVALGRVFGDYDEQDDVASVEWQRDGF